MSKNIVIVGGGNSAHTIIPLLSKTDFKVSLLTSKPLEWSHSIELEYQDVSGRVIQTIHGSIDDITNNPQKCIPMADYIILCMPVHKYRVALQHIAPYINHTKEVVLGTVYGQGGFNWMVEEIQQKYMLPNLIFFAFGLIPWICRTIIYGRKGVTYGFKTRNAAAVFPAYYFNMLNHELFNSLCYDWFGKGRVEQLDNFMSITLSVDNQIIHPSRCYAITQKFGYNWRTIDEVPMFYKDYDSFSAQCLADLDGDYSKIRNKIRQLYPQKDFHYMLNYLELEHYTYGPSSVDIVDSFVNSPTLQCIGTPVVVNDDGRIELDTNCRFFTDDIYYGIAIAKWIAEQLNIDVPMIDKLLHWAQEMRDEEIISQDNRLLINSMDLSTPLKSGIPYYYGKKTIDDIID